MTGHMAVFQEIIKSAMNDYARGVLVVRKLYPSQNRHKKMEIMADFKSAVYFLWGGGLEIIATQSRMDRFLNITAVQEQTLQKAERVAEWVGRQPRFGNFFGQRGRVERYIENGLGQ